MQEKRQVAGCLIFDDYGRLVLLHKKQDEYHESGGAWYIPGGKREDDESLEDTAIREIKEELGVDVTLQRKLRHEAFIDNGMDFEFHWFVVEITAGELRVCEPEIFDDVDYIALEDMDSLALSPATQVVVGLLMSGEIVLEQ